MLADPAAEIPTKHIVFTNATAHNTVETQAATVAEFLRERGIVRQPGDSVSCDAQSAVVDGETLVYRPGVRVALVVDGVRRELNTSAQTVGAVVAAEQLRFGSHDTLQPAARTPIEPDVVIRLIHGTSWLERVRSAILPGIRRRYDVGMATGSTRVVDPGVAGTKETTVEVVRPSGSDEAKRFVLAARILRFPRAKVVAEGVGDYSALAGVARRGMAGTLRLADAALKMVATAYTAACPGCSGMTASGRRAGHGVVAVDPRYIPLGSQLFIPGYGHAFAGDTGGSIRGNRIDLGFDSHTDAMSFGRRAVVVYVLK